MKKFAWLLFLLTSSLVEAESYPLLSGQTTQPLVFFMTLASDHISACTGITATVTLSKNGGSFASPSGTVSEIANGWYKVAGNATDEGTKGPLLLHATSGTCDNTDSAFYVVGYDPQDAVRLGLTALPAVASGSAGAIPTTGTGANQISLSSGLTSANTTQFAGQTITAAAGVTIPSSIASPTNITAGTIGTATTCGTVNALANNSITAASTASDYVTEMTTAATAATPTIASVSGSVGSVAGNVTGSVGSLATQAKTDVTTATTAATPACASVSSRVNANIQQINGTTVNGNGSSIPWGP